jgi:hypothetical protein
LYSPLLGIARLCDITQLIPELWKRCSEHVDDTELRVIELLDTLQGVGTDCLVDPY